MVGFHRLDWDQLSTSIGYWIAERQQGTGTVTRAAAALVDHAFGVWKLNRLEIRAGVENDRSRAIPERLGFTQEGVLREPERVGGRFVDHAVYAILAEVASRFCNGRRRMATAATCHPSPTRSVRGS